MRHCISCLSEVQVAYVVFLEIERDLRGRMSVIM